MLLPLSWLGNITWYAAYVQADKVLLESKEYYQKQSIRSGCLIYGANGVQKLSVPVYGRNSKIPMDQVKIDNSTRWQAIQRNALASAYKRSAFFEHYEHRFAPLFEERTESLQELNLKGMEIILKILKADKTYELTSEYLAEYPEGADLRSAEVFRHLNHQVNHHNPYFQVFAEKHGFKANLSVLDLLFNKGPEAISYLRNPQLLTDLR